MSYSFGSNKRRGLSSIVGGLIFVVLMVGTFSAVLLAMDSQSDIVDTNREVSNTELKKQQEKFSVNIYTNSTEHLFLEVDNFGQNPVEIYDLVITNSTDFDNNFPTEIHSIPAKTSFVASGFKENVISNTPMKLSLADIGETEIYDFKVISSLGTIKTQSILCDDSSCSDIGSDSTLTATLFLDGPNGVNTKTSTVVMFVSNTGAKPIEDVSPVVGFPSPSGSDCSGMLTDITTLPPPAEDLFTEQVTNCSVTPNLEITLQPYQTTLFKWDMTVHGDIGAVFEFCNSVQGTHPDNGPITSGAPSCDTLTIIDPNDCNGCEGGPTIILVDDLLIRPELFMIVPSPWGDTDGSKDYKGLWGVNVVNPTEKAMNVTKITIVSYPPGANNNDITIDAASCLISGISPTNGWSCPRLNTILWQDVLNPLEIPPYSNVPFMALLEPGQISANADIDALIVQANAFTTTGSFGKSSYQSTMFDTPEVIASVYMTDVDGSRAAANIQSDRLGFNELSEQEFKITLADFDDDNTTYIKEGSRLIINVPREWTDVEITGEIGFVADGDPGPADDRITFFGDESHQIIAVTSQDIGGDSVGNDLDDALTLTFNATAPQNDQGIDEQLYIMYVLADGLTGDNNPIGPLNEIVLQALALP